MTVELVVVVESFLELLMVSACMLCLHGTQGVFCIVRPTTSCAL